MYAEDFRRCQRAGIGEKRPPSQGVLLKLAYDGSEFHGWAPQPSVRTVEETLRHAIRHVDALASAPRGTSRTDAGVHAEAQMVAFDAALAIPARSWVLAINQHLPDDVAVRAARYVPTAYNPRFSAVAKRYRYRLSLDRVRDPLCRGRRWKVNPDLDVASMANEARALVGTHDFAAFRSAGDARDVTTRTITRVAIERGVDPSDVSIVVEGSAFLYNMVRIIAGTLVDIGTGRKASGTVQRALDDKMRQTAGTTAPSHGLTLEHVELELPEEASEPWPP